MDSYLKCEQSPGLCSHYFGSGLFLQRPSSSRLTIPSANWMSSSLTLILRILSGILFRKVGRKFCMQSEYICVYVSCFKDAVAGFH